MDQRPFYVRALLCLLGNISGIDQVPRKNQIIHIQIFCSSSPINDRRTRSSCGFGDSGVMWKSERCKIRFISCSFLLLCENTYNHTQIAITSWDTNWNPFYILYRRFFSHHTIMKSNFTLRSFQGHFTLPNVFYFPMLYLRLLETVLFVKWRITTYYA